MVCGKKVAVPTVVDVAVCPVEDVIGDMVVGTTVVKVDEEGGTGILTDVEGVVTVTVGTGLVTVGKVNKDAGRVGKLKGIGIGIAATGKTPTSP